MKDKSVDWQKINALLDEMELLYRKELLVLGRRIIPTLTPEDMLQPNDYLELNQHPEFRYEEGLLAGIQTVQMALRALQKDELTLEYVQNL